MIARVWHGWTRPENADAYERLLRAEIFVGIEARGIEGFRGIDLLRRVRSDEVEFVTVMWFESLAAVRAFAGTDHEAAVVPPAARALLERFDARSAHYEVLERRSPLDRRHPSDGAAPAPGSRRRGRGDGRHLRDQRVGAPWDPDMPDDVNLYDSHYGHLDADPLAAVRRETYDEDLGQASWLTLAEAREFFRLLGLGPGQAVLEVACGSGGVTCRMAVETGATCVGIDLNARGIEAAVARAAGQGLATRVSFQALDAGNRLPFPDESFDAVLCNDSINHLPGRLEVLRDWHRVLRPGGRLLFTDPVVVTGQLTNEEVRIRSSIGFFLFTPAGCNERLLARSGFRVREVRDVTGAVADVSRKWRAAREARREALVNLEGEGDFEGVQRFLEAVRTLASERRLSRYMYLASKPVAHQANTKGASMASNLDTIRGAYDAFARGDVPAVLAILAPTVRWTEAEGFPYGGTYSGPDAVLSGVFMKLGTEWDGYSAVPREFVAEGDTVVALGHYSGTYKKTGRRFSAPFAHVWEFQDGKVVRFRQYTDTALVQKALV